MKMQNPDTLHHYCFKAFKWLVSHNNAPAVAFLWIACTTSTVLGAQFSVNSSAGAQRGVDSLAVFDRPWAMCFLPDGRALVTEKDGNLWLIDSTDSGRSGDKPVDVLENASADSLIRSAVEGLPKISARGQGGLGDVIIHPAHAQNQLVYISYVEREGKRAGAAVARAGLDRSDAANPSLVNWEVIWRQVPKVSGQGHFGHRLAFSDDGFLYISSGERQKFDPAQDMSSNLGKIIRLHEDGSIPEDNPFVDKGDVAAEVWSLGHRNPLGMAFDGTGRLWVHEMGPKGGDELNEIMPAANYGYPLVSNGRHYSGFPIPNHDTRPDLQAPAISWSPVISPAGFVVYSADRYAGWSGSGLIGGLSSRSLVRVALGKSARELERFDMGKRIREVEQGPTGLVYLLEDKSGGRLLRLKPD